MGRETTRLEKIDMGFDLHGEGPFNPPKEEEDIWKNKNFEKREQYFIELRKYERDNPGYYFHNTVWLWRPLWNLITNLCEDILTLQDIEGGMYNDFHLIGKAKSKRIAKRLSDSMKKGDVQKWAQEREQHLEDLPLVECNICDGKGYRNLDDSKVSRVCNGCQGKKVRPHFDHHYVFELTNVERFIKFCKHSGGFRIG